MKALVFMLLISTGTGVIAQDHDIANAYDYYNYKAFAGVEAVPVSSQRIVVNGSDGSVATATIQACRLNGRQQIIHRIVLDSPKYMLVRNVMVKYRVTAMDRTFPYNYNFVAAYTDMGLYWRMNCTSSGFPQGKATIKFLDCHAKVQYKAEVSAQWLMALQY